MNFRHFVIGLLPLLILTSCNETKEKLKGKRESFIVVDDALKPDATLQKLSVQLPPAHNIQDWPCVGGTPSHLVHPATIAKNPQKIWEISIGQGADVYHRLITHPIIHNNTIYTMDLNGVVKAYNASTKEVIWELNIKPEDLDETIMGGGFFAHNNELYITTAFGDIWCVERKTGKKIWKESLGTPMRAAPTVYEGRIFVVSVNNEIHALDAKTGERLWDYTGLIESSFLLGASAPAAAPGVVVFTLTSGEVYAFGPQSGHVMWTDTLTPALRIDTVSSIAHIRARPIIDGNVVYVASHGGKLAAYEVYTGKKIWSRDIGVLRTPAVAGDFMFLVTTNDDLVCLLKTTGQVKWAVQLPRKREYDEVVTWAGPIVVNNQLALTGTDGRLLFVNTADGTIDKTFELGAPCQISPIIANQTLYTLTDTAFLQAWK